MKRVFSNRAITLIELIVATLLVVVIISGIMAVNSALRNSNQDYGQKYFLKSETQAALNHMLNNASLAVGSANANDEAILVPGMALNTGSTGTTVTDAHTFCIHQPQGNGNNLINYAGGDIWLCYQWYPSTDPTYPYQIRWCAEKYTAGADPRGASSCSTAGGNLLPDPTTGNTITFLGTAYSITSTAGTSLASSPSFIANGSQLLFSINILNCLDNSDATNCGQGSTAAVSKDPVDNPEVQVSGSVVPQQASM
ncbi:MAG: type II secretion system protein [Candidatus Omnitrophica bacterium]|nr:type II secretion system protein [Candidatus Omnitrophota bacterium]